ncbi:hypothetical protein EB118_08700 [bacterium]|nr:hypothetical protein [bacterium]NBX98601.1 hypothetical protein [bacterium]NDC94694.1 hypothetical protein [bacterium]NDD84224.1 hypothetical protein [bacterium]NDG30141.1 hypothetical protein [bacterium]
MNNPNAARTRQSPEVYARRRFTAAGIVGIVGGGLLAMLASFNANPEQYPSVVEVTECAQDAVNTAQQNGITYLPLGALETFVIDCSDAGVDRGGSYLSGEKVTQIAQNLSVQP